ncbi:SipW-dependent-type signal peptide-containing protein [Haloarchaeobius sp. TZWSO28]|uniref:SipW-dependent-type signal peptide-containing protein n=1 Tax=Haloarchaeobius sp. TZWSO28 TaxID=3446119 RepID=UPI003EB76235
MHGRNFELTRRRLLALTGTVGVSSAGAGLGTSAFFSDTETFEGNQLVAGQLDVQAAWTEFYADGQDSRGFLDASQEEQDTLVEQKGTIEPDSTNCLDGTVEGPIIDIRDAKPGDSGRVEFDVAFCNNPAQLWMTGSMVSNTENGYSDPEASDNDEDVHLAGIDESNDHEGELLSELETTITVTTADGQTYEAFSGPLFDAMLAILNDQGPGLALDGDPDSPFEFGTASTDASRDCFDSLDASGNLLTHSITLEWELAADHANEIQGDGVSFDVGFYAEQCRHNDGGGDGFQNRLFTADMVSDTAGTMWSPDEVAGIERGPRIRVIYGNETIAFEIRAIAPLQGTNRDFTLAFDATDDGDANVRLTWNQSDGFQFDASFIPGEGDPLPPPFDGTFVDDSTVVVEVPRDVLADETDDYRFLYQANFVGLLSPDGADIVSKIPADGVLTLGGGPPSSASFQPDTLI